jgi:hypothetical protein
MANGMLSYRDFAPPEETSDAYRDYDFDDIAEELGREQREVRRTLYSIAVLTMTLPPPVGAGREWDPRWHPQGQWSDELALTPGLPVAFQEPTRDNHVRLVAFLLNDSSTAQ